VSKRNTFTLKDAEEYLQMDTSDMETECATHSILVDRVGVEYAHAVDRRDTLKSQLKQLDAKIALDIRKKANREGDKITDIMLTRMVITDERYVDKNKLYLEANLEVGLWEAKKEAYKDRTYMITDASNIVLGGIRGNIVVKNKNAEEAAYEQSKKKYMLMEREKQQRRKRLNREEE
jgi:hypothetical protein